ncbi:MAG TPA: outer membrane beta-barrel protein [Gallionellaceae bacterium]|nr:outer membrane beta-barrel protein [Gallionellaceae bacterium]
MSISASRFFFWSLRCLLVAGSLLPLTVSAQSWYLGASAGQSSINASPADIETGFLLDDGFTASGTTLEKQDRAGKAYAGYRFNRFLAAEAGYVDLGEARFNTTIVAAPPGTTPSPPFPIHATATARGAFLNAIVHWPVTQGFSLFAKAGAFRSDAKFTEVIQGTDITRVSRTELQTDVNYGAGLQWVLTGMVGARLEWERFRNIGRGIGGREGIDIDLVSAGLMLQF